MAEKTLPAGVGEHIITWDNMDYYMNEQEWEEAIVGPDKDLYEGWERLDYCGEDTNNGWSDFIIALTERLKMCEPYSSWWRVDGTGMGWDSREGYKIIDLENKAAYRKVEIGQILMWELNINSQDNRLKVYHYTSPAGQKGLAIDNAHHDVPRGGEWYFIVPLKED